MSLFDSSSNAQINTRTLLQNSAGRCHVKGETVASNHGNELFLMQHSFWAMTANFCQISSHCKIFPVLLLLQKVLIVFHAFLNMCAKVPFLAIYFPSKVCDTTVQHIWIFHYQFLLIWKPSQGISKKTGSTDSNLCKLSTKCINVNGTWKKRFLWTTYRNRSSWVWLTSHWTIKRNS